MNQDIKLCSIDFNSLIKNETTVILNSNCQSKMIEILNKEFTESENRWFIANLYIYMNYHPTNEFPINLETLVSLVGFANKENAKRTLKNNFTKDIDYKVLLVPKDEQVKINGGAGLNKEKVMLNIDTFKNMCMLVKTEKSKEIRRYYVKLENIYNKIIKEEMDEQKKVLQEKLLEHKEQSELEKQELLEKTILEQFQRNTQCVYYGTIDDISLKDEELIKYGNSNDLPARIKCHKKTYTNFKLVKAYKVNNQLHIENCIKQHDKLKNRRRNITINDKLYTECLALNDKFTIDKIDEHIKEIINEFEYNVENYNKLILKNEELNNIIYDLRDENEKLKNDNDKLQKKVDDFQPELDIKKKTISDSLQGSLLFAFECTESNLKKYKCEMIKEKGLDEKIEMYKKIYPDGKLVFTKKIKTINVYKIIQYMLKKHLIYVGEDTYTGDIDAIKLIYNIVAKIEEKFILNESLEDTLELLENNTVDQNVVETDPEQPQIRKAKREIEQIDKNTGRVIARYESLNAAARALNCTGNAVGIALRNSTLCKGFVWKYVGVTLDQQLTSQKVIKICCEDGTRTKFNSYVEAGKDGGVSSVTIRNRILTNVHSRLNGKNYHWIIDTEK